MHKYIISVLLILLSAACSKFSKIQKSTDITQKYDAAIKYYEKKDYYKAGILLEETIPLLKGSKESEIAQFYFAYCHYHQSQYELAAFYFKRFYETFSRSGYAEEAMYMYGYSLYDESPKYNLDQSNTNTAIQAMQAFLNTYPQSQYKEQGNNIIAELRKKLEKKAYEGAKLYYKIDNYKAALVALENFQQSFPDSDYYEEVSFLKIETAYNLAKQSTEKKQLDRYKEAITHYETFVDKFPKSKYIKSAENIYSSSIEAVQNISKKNKNS